MTPTIWKRPGAAAEATRRRSATTSAVRISRIARAAVRGQRRLTAAALLTISLTLLGAAPAASAAGGTGWLRLAHLSPNTPPVDVYLYSFGDAHAIIVLHHVGYGAVSPFEPVRSGEYTVAMRPAGAPASTKPVLSTNVDISSGRAYTVAGMGPAKGLRLQIIPDRLRTPPGKALVRVIQASLRQHRVTVRLGRKTLARAEPFASLTSYRAVSPGTWTVHARGASEQATVSVSLAAGSIHTLVVLDKPGGLAVVALEDAAGASQPPSGGAATGFGGTAPVPGPSPAPWLALAGAGLALAGAGLHTRRRLARPGRAGQATPSPGERRGEPPLGKRAG
jgi:hypothetical protein